MTMTQHWREVISQTCETEFLDVESFITSQNGQGLLSAHLKAAINVWENSAVISGSQVVDGVSTQYPTSYLVEMTYVLAPMTVCSCGSRKQDSPAPQ